MRKSAYYINDKNLKERKKQYRHETGPETICLSDNPQCKKGYKYNPPLGKDYGLADSIGMTRSAFSEKRNGKQTISVDDLQSLANLLGCDWKYLACTKESDGTLKPCSEYITERQFSRSIEKQIESDVERHNRAISAALELITASGRIGIYADPIKHGDKVIDNFEYIVTINGNNALHMNKHMIQNICTRIQKYAIEQITLLSEYECLKTDNLLATMRKSSDKKP